jgi:hypothetical protein
MLFKLNNNAKTNGDNVPRACLTRIILIAACLLAAAGTLTAQDIKDVAALRQHNLPGMLIVIFSPEVDSSRRTSAQGAVWNSFVAKLKKNKVLALEVVNEVAINEGADRARAFELAQNEQNKFTVWLQFSAVSDSMESDRSKSVDSERLVAKYIVFAPASNDILGQGEIEQERVPESRFETVNNQKAIRDNSGRVINNKPAMKLPDGSSSNGQKTMDLDALTRVGELVGERAVNAVKKYEKAKAR